MRVLMLLCVLGVGAASAQFNAYVKKNQDGAEYDASNNRVYKHFSNPTDYTRSSLDFDYGRERRQVGKNKQNAPRIRRNRPLKQAASRRNKRPSAYAEQRPEVQEARATDRQGYVFNPNQQPQRQVRPVQKQVYEDVPRYQEQESRFEPSRYTAPKKSYSGRPYTPAKKQDAEPYRKLQDAEPYRKLQEAEPYSPPQPIKDYDYVPKKPIRPRKTIERVYTEPASSIEQLNEVYVEPEIVENRYREPEPQRQKIFERNADVEVVDDQLEGESFQPAYTPYQPPPAAYDSNYVPVEQKSIEAAVAAGAAAYPGEGYKDPERLSFQIHGQEGPHSYRFGYDTGVGYNRQFRYEERDQYGVLHGRYGYYDQAGKLQVVNYTADPVAGFHAEGEHVPKPQY